MKTRKVGDPPVTQGLCQIRWSGRASEEETVSPRAKRQQGRPVKTGRRCCRQVLRRLGSFEEPRARGRGRLGGSGLVGMGEPCFLLVGGGFLGALP
jgi:hypothetical protein